MNTIRIETHIDSDTLVLPQLLSMLGKDVEIVVKEKAKPVITAARSDWNSVYTAVMELENYDSEAYRAARELELQNTDSEPR